MRRLDMRFGGLSDAGVNALKSYRWPGNMREMLRCALTLGDAEPLAAAQLQTRFAAASSAAPTGALKQILEDAERKAIVDALNAVDANVELAAERLD